MKNHFSQIKVKTKRLIIRPLKYTDYQAWLNAYTSRKPKMHKYDGNPIDPSGKTKTWFNKLVRKHKKNASDDKVYVFAIFDKRTKEHVGSLDFATIQRYNMNWANLGYAVHNTHQGKGYAKEFVTAAIQKIAFTKLKYKRVEAAINIDNRRSINLAKTVGMKKECVRPEFFFENGEWVDHVIYIFLSKNRKLEKFS